MTRLTTLLILAAFILAGCSASVAAGDAAKQAAEHQATVDAMRAQADLTAAQAFSSTLASQANQVDRLVNATIDQAAAWRATTVLLIVVVGLVAVVVVGAFTALALAGRRPATRPAAPIVYIVAAPTMPAIDATPAAPAILAPSVLDVARWQLAHRERAALPAPEVEVDHG
jgi:ABC-type transport system involved in cytochrome bd biosynthesis fused ATPase/permease subunit